MPPIEAGNLEALTDEAIAEMSVDQLVWAIRAAHDNYPDNTWRAELVRKLWEVLDYNLSNDLAPLPTEWANGR